MARAQGAVVTPAVYAAWWAAWLRACAAWGWAPGYLKGE